MSCGATRCWRCWRRSRVRQTRAGPGPAARVSKEFVYQASDGWSRARRVVAKAEYLEKGENPRFVVTLLATELWAARPLYEELYCTRGKMENHIKEQRVLFADRASIPSSVPKSIGEKSGLCIRLRKMRYVMLITLGCDLDHIF